MTPTYDNLMFFRFAGYFHDPGESRPVYVSNFVYSILHTVAATNKIRAFTKRSWNFQRVFSAAFALRWTKRKCVCTIYIYICTDVFMYVRLVAYFHYLSGDGF